MSLCPSSFQGPPNYGTYAGLHSNQILTVKVCPFQQTSPCPPSSHRSLSGCWTVFLLTLLTFPFGLQLLGLLNTLLFFSHRSCCCFPSLWTLSVKNGLQIFLFIDVLLLFPFYFHPFFLPVLFPSTLSFSLSLLLHPQMAFPRYDHGFLSGEQSGSFQRRFLKVDHHWGMCAFFNTLINLSRSAVHPLPSSLFHLSQSNHIWPLFLNFPVCACFSNCMNTCGKVKLYVQKVWSRRTSWMMNHTRLRQTQSVLLIRGRIEDVCSWQFGWGRTLQCNYRLGNRVLVCCKCLTPFSWKCLQYHVPCNKTNHNAPHVSKRWVGAEKVSSCDCREHPGPPST